MRNQKSIMSILLIVVFATVSFLESFTLLGDINQNINSGTSLSPAILTLYSGKI